MTIRSLLVVLIVAISILWRPLAHAECSTELDNVTATQMGLRHWDYPMPIIPIGSFVQVGNGLVIRMDGGNKNVELQDQLWARAAAAAGWVNIVPGERPADFKPGAPLTEELLLDAVFFDIVPTEASRANSKRSGIPELPGSIWLYDGVITNLDIYSNQKIENPANTLRVISFTYLMTEQPPGMDESYAEMARLTRDTYPEAHRFWAAGYKPFRKRMVLLRLDPETCKWNSVAWDTANVEDDFVTRSVERALIAAAGEKVVRHGDCDLKMTNDVAAKMAALSWGAPAMQFPVGSFVETFDGRLLRRGTSLSEFDREYLITIRAAEAAGWMTIVPGAPPRSIEGFMSKQLLLGAKLWDAFPTTLGRANSAATGLPEIKGYIWYYIGPKRNVSILSNRQFIERGRILHAIEFTYDREKSEGLDKFLAKYAELKPGTPDRFGRFDGPGREHALVEFDELTCTWELRAFDIAEADGTYRTSRVEMGLVRVMSGE